MRKKLENHLLSYSNMMSNDLEFGYYHSDTNKEYLNYISNNCFDDLVNLLEVGVYSKYIKQIKTGAGGEFNKTNSRPPKFASVSSSSRFCFNCFKPYLNKGLTFDFTGKEEVYNSFNFELKLNILNPKSSPNMDIVLQSNNSIVFIESKMAEPLSIRDIKFSLSYKDRLEEVFSNYKATRDDKYSYIDFNQIGKCRFDIPQAVKHMFGIHDFITMSQSDENYCLTYQDKNLGCVKLGDIKNICLCFLTYIPDNFNPKINNLYDSLKPNDFGIIETDNINFKEIFDLVFKDIRHVNITYKFITNEDLKVA